MRALNVFLAYYIVAKVIAGVFLQPLFIHHQCSSSLLATNITTTQS